jgi:acetyltransferase-like isoleucine patch superfamily enzyme
MPNDDRTKIIYSRTPESAAMLANVKRAMAITATIGKPIAIEKSVWIATGATIIGGVTVGENSVVAAGSVVTKDVPPNTLVGGNPARVIRSIGD